MDKWSSRDSKVGVLGHFCKHCTFIVVILHIPLQNNVLVTGGEDSKINAWYSPPLDSKPSALDNQQNDVPMDVDDSQFRKRVWEPEPDTATSERVCNQRHTRSSKLT
jgi:hypothetical protein